MYTHIGNGIILKNKEVIGIFNIKTMQNSRENKRMLLEIQKIEYKGFEKEELDLRKSKIKNRKMTMKDFTNKSVILIESDDDENKYVVSQIAVSTLKKRLEKGVYN